MKKVFVNIIFIIYSISFFGQENPLLKEVKKLDNAEKQMNYVLDMKVPDIPTDGFSKLLKIKLNSELNTLGDLFSYYANGKDLKLSKKEQWVLEERVTYLAKWFVEEKKYVIVRDTGGVSPSIGVSLDTIANKKVLVLLMGGSCTISETDERSNYIYKFFNNKVTSFMTDQK